ncbi:MAG: hypothetical protein ABW185_28560 [Sedimenticola sp.]
MPSPYEGEGQGEGELGQRLIYRPPPHPNPLPKGERELTRQL